MRKLNTKTTILLGLFGVSASLVGVAACSSEDTVIPGDDSGVDSGVIPPDTGPVEPVDSGDAAEASADSAVVDSGYDSGWDAGVDAGPDFDAGVSEVDGGVVQNPITPAEFLTSMSQIFCGKAKGCCAAIPGTPAFDFNKCVEIFKVQGWEASAAGTSAPGVLTSGHLNFDPVSAKACLRDIALVACVNDAQTFKTVTNDCFKAFNGNLTIGSTCVKSIECAPGSYCAKTPVDGGPAGDLATGKCASLKAVGAACDYAAEDRNSGFGMGECTSRGAPATFCSTTDGKAGTCAAQLADLAVPPYVGNSQCLSGIQNAPDPVTYGDLKCGGSQALIFKSTCDFTYALKDAGP